MGNANIGICQYRNASSSKKCNIPISKESVNEGIMLCNFHRRKMATSTGLFSPPLFLYYSLLIIYYLIYF